MLKGTKEDRYLGKISLMMMMMMMKVTLIEALYTGVIIQSNNKSVN